MLSSAWMRYCLILWTLDVHLCSRSPQGERGLKFSRGTPISSIPGRSPQGERGLKCWRGVGAQSEDCRSPQGERGLKYGGYGGYCLKFVSLPARGAWIEIRRGASPPQ